MSSINIKKIAVCGTQGQGKTTFIKDFIKEYPSYKTPEKTYREYVAEKGLSLNRDADKETQNAILTFMEDQLMTDYKDQKMIFDRCPIDNLVYSMWLANYNKGGIDDAFIQQCINRTRESLKFLDIILFIPLTSAHKVELVPDGTRDIDPNYVKEIDTLFKSIFQTYRKRVGNIFDFENCPAIVEIYGPRDVRIAMTKLYLQESGDAIDPEKDSLISKDDTLAEAMKYRLTQPLMKPSKNRKKNK